MQCNANGYRDVRLKRHLRKAAYQVFRSDRGYAYAKIPIPMNANVKRQGLTASLSASRWSACSFRLMSACRSLNQWLKFVERKKRRYRPTWRQQNDTV